MPRNPGLVDSIPLGLRRSDILVSHGARAGPVRRQAPTVNANGVLSSSPGLFRPNETTLDPSHPTEPTTLKGLYQRAPDCAGGKSITGDATLSGLMRVMGIGSQGSSFLATLGWLIQSRWD